MQELERFHAFADTYAKTFRSAEWDAWGRLFARDADFVTWRGVWWRSRDEIVAGHRDLDPWLQAQTANYTLEALAVRSPRTDVAVLQARWTWPAFRPDTGAPEEDRSGLVAMVLTRDAEGWLICTSHNLRLA